MSVVSDKHFTAYLAGSIFYYADELRNREWAAKLREAFPNMDLYSPIENTEINGTEGKKKCATSYEIVEADNERLEKTDVLIACIDGDLIPAGTACEIGFAAARIDLGFDDNIIIGICTDNRQAYLTNTYEKYEASLKELGETQTSYQNIYVTGMIKTHGALVSNIEDAIWIIGEWARLHDRGDVRCK